ncbi:MAG: hypothetical protein ACXVCX_20395 [Ktedonobacterales bacterium]
MASQLPEQNGQEQQAVDQLDAIQSRLAALESVITSQQSEIEHLRAARASASEAESMPLKKRASRRSLLKLGGAAAAAGVAAAAVKLSSAPTADAAGVGWATGTVAADAETLVQPSSSGYSANDLLQVRLGTGTVFQAAALKAAITAYDTTTNNIGVYGTSQTGFGLYGVTQDGVGANGAGLNGSGTGTGTGVQGHSQNGIGVQGNSANLIGGSFTGGLAPLSLGLAATAGAPQAASGAHTAGEIYLDSQANVFVCVASGTPGTWRSLSVAGMNFLPAPFRFVDTRGGSGTPYSGQGPWATNSNHIIQITGLHGVPAGAKGFFGNVTVAQTAGNGYLRLYPAGAALPGTSTINYVANQIVANACIVGLSSGGALAIHVDGSSTQVILDVAGYIL